MKIPRFNSLFEVVNHNKEELLYISRLSAVLSMHDAWKNCKSQPHEPDFVASLVINMTKYLGNGWKQILQPHGINFKVSGIFCHQTPKIQFHNIVKSSCELGDLLLCFFHRDKFGNTIRNAILFQAKCSVVQPMPIKKNGEDQLYLYSTWPEFKFVSSGKLNGQIRQIKPSAPNLGAQYLLIDKRPVEVGESGLLGLPNTYPIGCCIAQNPLIIHSDLGQELVEFISLCTGNTFDDWEIAKNEIGWSRIIWDLIQSSTHKAFRRSISGIKGEPRVHDYQLESFDGHFVSTSGHSELFESILGKEGVNILESDSQNTPPGFQERQWYDDGMGVSVIFFESTELVE